MKVADSFLNDLRVAAAAVQDVCRKFEDCLMKETNQMKLKQYSSNLFKWLKNHFEDMQTSQGLFPSVKWLVTISINCTQSATKQNKNHRNLTKNFNINISL